MSANSDVVLFAFFFHALEFSGQKKKQMGAAIVRVGLKGFGVYGE